MKVTRDPPVSLTVGVEGNYRRHRLPGLLSRRICFSTHYYRQPLTSRTKGMASRDDWKDSGLSKSQETIVRYLYSRQIKFVFT